MSQDMCSSKILLVTQVVLVLTNRGGTLSTTKLTSGQTTLDKLVWSTASIVAKYLRKKYFVFQRHLDNYRIAPNFCGRIFL